MKPFVAIAFIVVAGAMVGLLMTMRHRASAGPQQREAAQVEQSTSAPTQARRAPSPEPAPILPSWGRRTGASAEGAPDPSWQHWSPWIRAGRDGDRVDMSAEGLAKSRKMAR